jgi:RNA polymerase sigma-70 factor (ECF subfamily)
VRLCDLHTDELPADGRYLAASIGVYDGSDRLRRAIRGSTRTRCGGWLVRGDDTDADDVELAARAVHDRAVFGVLYDRHAAAIFRYCYRRLGERAAAEDATSGTFVRAIEALPTFRGGSFRAWLFAIAHSVVVDGTRRRAERALEDTLDIVDPAASPEETAIAADERRQVVALLASLPEDQRRVIELRLAGLSGNEIAESIGKSVAAVKMLQHRAMRRFRRTLAAQTTPGVESHG